MVNILKRYIYKYCLLSLSYLYIFDVRKFKIKKNDRIFKIFIYDYFYFMMFRFVFISSNVCI